jgi:hypothetical protein
MFFETSNAYCFPCCFLTPWSRVIEKLIVAHLVNKFPDSYETRMFTAVMTWTRQWTLSRVNTPTLYFSISITSHLCLGLPCAIFLPGFSKKYLHAFLSSHACYTSRLSYPPCNICCRLHNMKPLILYFFLPCCFICLWSE